MSDSEIITVEILGTRLQLRGGEDPDTVSRVANYVKERVEEVAERASTKPTLQIALLAAINIAHELYQVMEQDRSDRETLEAALERANRILAKTGGAKA